MVKQLGLFHIATIGWTSL